MAKKPTTKVRLRDGDQTFELVDVWRSGLHSHARMLWSDNPRWQEAARVYFDKVAALLAVVDRDRFNNMVRRKDKPNDDPSDTSRNRRIRNRHAELVRQNRHDAMSQTATDFGLSVRQTSRIVNNKAP